jgi:hypothetical protein
MGTITKTVQQRVEMCQQKQMKVDELTQLAWEDAADYLCERYKKYSIYELKVRPIVQLQMNEVA